MKRRIDALGRVVLPADLRRDKNWSKGNFVNIEVENDKVILTPTNEQCVICGTEEGPFLQIEDRTICTGCAERIRRRFPENRGYREDWE